MVTRAGARGQLTEGKGWPHRPWRSCAAAYLVPRPRRAALPTLCRARASRVVIRPTEITQRVCHRLTGRYEGRSVLVRPRPSRTSSANLDGNLTCIWITPGHCPCANARRITICSSAHRRPRRSDSSLSPARRYCSPARCRSRSSHDAPRPRRHLSLWRLSCPRQWTGHHT